LNFQFESVKDTMVVNVSVVKSQFISSHDVWTLVWTWRGPCLGSGTGKYLTRGHMWPYVANNGFIDIYTKVARWNTFDLSS